MGEINEKEPGKEQWDALRDAVSTPEKMAAFRKAVEKGATPITATDWEGMQEKLKELPTEEQEN